MGEGERKRKRKRKRRRREEEVKPKSKKVWKLTLIMDSMRFGIGSLVLYGYYLASNLGFVRISS